MLFAKLILDDDNETEWYVRPEEVCLFTNSKGEVAVSTSSGESFAVKHTIAEMIEALGILCIRQKKEHMTKNNKVTTEKAHATYGASGSDRWLNCPGSVQLSMSAPAQKESPYAEEGTKAHSCLEAFLRSKDDFLTTQKKLLKEKYPKEMVNYAADAFHTITDMAAEFPDAEILCETKVELDFVEPGEFGTVDAAIVDVYGVLSVIDFKYGAGHVVDPAGNSQLIYYALGLAHKYDYEFSAVRLVIIQPRAFTPDGSTVRVWETTVAHLQEMATVFKNAIAISKLAGAPLHAGEHCKFCKAAPICPQISTKALKQAQIDFDFADDKLPDVTLTHAIPDIQLPRMLKAFPLIRKWMESVELHALHRLESNSPVTGWKLVPKRGKREWVNEAKTGIEAFELFGPKATHSPELKSPNQLETEFKNDPLVDIKKWVAERVTVVSSGHSMVEESDPRPAINPADDFDLIDEELIHTKPINITKGKTKK